MPTSDEEDVQLSQFDRIVKFKRENFRAAGIRDISKQSNRYAGYGTYKTKSRCMYGCSVYFIESKVTVIIKCLHRSVTRI